jgi:hypothetical protein
LAFEEAGKNKFDKIDNDLEEASYRHDKFTEMISQLKELELSEPKMLEKLFKYQAHQNRELEKEANDVMKEYKSGVMDPSREAAKFERKTGRNIRKKN